MSDIRRGYNQQVIKLTGSPVKMKQQMDDGGWMNATAARIDYDQNRDTVIFSGDAVVKQPGRGSISGERIVYNMATGQVQSGARSEEHTSELQSLMRISYDVFCLKKKTKQTQQV